MRPDRHFVIVEPWGPSDYQLCADFDEAWELLKAHQHSGFQATIVTTAGTVADIRQILRGKRLRVAS